MLAPGQLSVNIASMPVTVAKQTDALVLTVLLAGQVIAGNWSSVTVIDCVHCAVRPAASVAVHVTTVVPTGYTPLALAVPLKLFVITAPEQLSANTGLATVTLAEHKFSVAVCV